MRFKSVTSCCFCFSSSQYCWEPEAQEDIVATESSVIEGIDGMLIAGDTAGLLFSECIAAIVVSSIASLLSVSVGFQVYSDISCGSSRSGRIVR